MNWQPTNPTFRALLNAFVHESSPLYIVGGLVRDLLLGRTSTYADLDLVTTVPALPLAKRIADRLGWAFYPLDESRDVARLVFTANVGEPLVCDIARMRGDTIETDLLTRDFTINAMAVALERNGQARLIDITGGQRDLQAKLVRNVSMASLTEDAVRMLRAVRLALQLNFAIENETRSQIERLSGTLYAASPERLRDELWKGLATAQPVLALEEMRVLGLLRHALPEVSITIGVEQSAPHHLNVYQHTLKVVQATHQLRAWLKETPSPADQLPESVQTMLAPYLFHLRQHLLKPMAGQRLRVDWLIWHALLHDIGKTMTRTTETLEDGTTRYRFLEHERRGAEMAEKRLTHLRFSRQEIDLTHGVITAHMRPHSLDRSFRDQPLSQRVRYRYFRDISGKQVIDPPGIDVLLLALADVQGTYAETPPHWSDYLRHINDLLHFAYYDQHAATSRQHPLVDGYILMKHFDLTPGPHIGALLEQIQEAQAAGELKSETDALKLAEQLLNETIFRKN